MFCEPTVSYSDSFLASKLFVIANIHNITTSSSCCETCIFFPYKSWRCKHLLFVLIMCFFAILYLYIMFTTAGSLNTMNCAFIHWGFDN